MIEGPFLSGSLGLPRGDEALKYVEGWGVLGFGSDWRGGFVELFD